jgi:hypothetical protein
MSKRTNFDKIPKDFYPTFDKSALVPAFVNDISEKTYAEPCCGEGDLVNLLSRIAVCKWQSDLENRGYGVVKDAMEVSISDIADVDMIITNPPYTKSIVLPMIDHFTALKPTWLLLPADWMHNIYFKPYLGKCSKIISIGRMSWMRNTKMKSTENYCWYFWEDMENKNTTFIGRT